MFRNPITPLDSPTPLRSTLRDRSTARLFDQGSQGLADWLEVVGTKKSIISELSNVSFGRRGEASLMMESGDAERLWWDASPLP